MDRTTAYATSRGRRAARAARRPRPGRRAARGRRPSSATCATARGAARTPCASARRRPGRGLRPARQRQVHADASARSRGRSPHRLAGRPRPLGRPACRASCRTRSTAPWSGSPTTPGCAAPCAPATGVVVHDCGTQAWVRRWLAREARRRGARPAPAAARRAAGRGAARPARARPRRLAVRLPAAPQGGRPADRARRSGAICPRGCGSAVLLDRARRTCCAGSASTG